MMAGPRSQGWNPQLALVGFPKNEYVDTNPNRDAAISVNKNRGPLDWTRADFTLNLRMRRATNNKSVNRMMTPFTIPKVIIAGITDALHPLSSLRFWQSRCWSQRYS